MKTLGKIEYWIPIRTLSEREFARRVNIAPRLLRYWRERSSDESLPKDNSNHPLILNRAVQFFISNSMSYEPPEYIEFDVVELDELEIAR